MLKKFNRLLALAAALFMGAGASAEAPVGQETRRPVAPPTVSGDQDAIIERAVRRRTLAQARQAAAERAKPKREAYKAAKAAGKIPQATGVKQQLGVVAPPGIMNPLGTPDYMGGVIPNWTNSPIIRKFVDTLPGLTAANKNNLGNYIPVAVADTTTFPGSDYYDIGLVDYTQQLHSDLPATRLRGYKDLNPNADGAAHYLGPLILAERDRPVRITFRNQLPLGTAGNLPLPVDTTLMGSGEAPGGTTYTQNRAELHLHGGLNPYISDGTPHQWITPAGDPTPNKKGAAFANVPDMVGPGKLFPNPTAGDGIGTYFYTNQQSSRLMFYHDHTFGLTRLNVYMGEAAGYLLVDDVEKKLIADGVLPNNGGGINTYGIPLIIQDKTFVPGPSYLADTDPTWDINNWGGYGDLWYPHVYMPNQNPGDPSGANAMGRWDYGPWFWPPVPVADAVNSIPLAHGPKPGINPGDPDYPGTPNPSLVIESFLDTPVINGTAYPTVTLEPKAYRFRVLNASNDRPFGMGFYYADPAAPTEVKMIPATPAEAALGPVDENGLPLWPTDGRDGGVVDFRTKGPDIIQIGNESGFLAEPFIIPSQPTTYNMNRRDIVVLNIANHGLFLMAAERADIIVDFSSVPSGSTLILYNDMLAPVPAFDVRFDYFTGAPDQTPTGGAPSTLPGYGPNTRTLMQVKIQGTPAAPFNVAALQAAFKSTATSRGAFAASQHPPIIPQTFYNSAMNTTVAADSYVAIQDNSLTYTKTENGQVTTTPLQPKAIHELFELNYGRMNSTLAIELPFTNFNNQTTIPLGYSEPATEILKDGETQIWKITHNGVDTHPVHFHLFDVQIINRVGWDGAVRFPEPNELGWKETVKMNPLEDIIVAMRPISPRLPFELGNSLRVIDPSKDPGSTIQITDLATGVPVNLGNLGNPIFVPNNVNDYGWEYVWHCHILAHEENDFMRPMVLKVATTIPGSPTNLVGTVNGPTRVDLSWTKNALTPNAPPADGVAIPVDETGFRVERSLAGANTFTTIGTTVPDQTNYTDFAAVEGTSYDYRVFSYNQKGDSAASALATGITPGAVVAPTGVTLTALPVTSVVKGTPVTFTALGSATGAATFQYRFYVNGVMVQDYSTADTYVMPGTQAVGVYTVTVDARTSAASAIVSATIPYTITPGPATGVQLLPNLPSPQQGAKGITFKATGIGSTSYEYQFSVDGVVVQAYSSTAIYSLSPFIAAGAHTIKADVRTNTASITPDATTTISYTILAATPATGVTLTPALASPQSTGTTVTFTAAGQGATAYQYEFWLTPSGGASTRVQSYSATPTWTLPSSTLPGTYFVGVNVRTISTASAQASTSATYVIQYTPATGVTLTPSLPSPQISGTPVLFTAAGQGSANYQYEFWLTPAGGASTKVQAYSTTATWTLPGSTPAGTYFVAVKVRTNTTVLSDAATTVTYKLNLPPATGVTLTPSPSSPRPSGTAVLFTAQGQGSSGYMYEFWLTPNAGTSTLVQAYSSTNTWTMPASTPAGKYFIGVKVRTSTSVVSDAVTTISYLLTP
jgi:FtsP/CotA-like multicopper oxidase with cupredoxin domain